MTAAKKAPTPPKAATPSAKASVSPQARDTASQAPSGPWVQVDDGLHELVKADPGPPPRYPHPASPAAWSHQATHDLFNAGRGADHQTARDNVMAVDVFRQPPAVQQYKAEILSWMDAAEAYHKENPR